MMMIMIRKEQVINDEYLGSLLLLRILIKVFIYLFILVPRLNLKSPRLKHILITIPFPWESYLDINRVGNLLLEFSEKSKAAQGKVEITIS